MKALPASSSLSVHLDGIRLYRDDVEQLLGLLANAGMQVKIRDNSFEYPTLDELSAGAGRSPRSIKIEANLPDGAFKVLVQQLVKRMRDISKGG